MPKVLVTGADGFIGSHLVERLVRRGAEVRAFTLYNSFGSRGWLDTVDDEIQQSVEYFAGDVRDPNGVREAVRGCDMVYHLAALIAIPYSYHSPDTYVDTNIKGTLNILQAARDYNVEKIVQTSTSEVYGSAAFVPITEDHPLQGQSPYAASKIGADQLALSFHYSFDLPVAIIRPFNTYGPRQSTRAVIPTIITQIAGGRRDIKLGALHPTRDFSYVTDTVRGFVAVAESEAAVGQAVNIGSNFEISIREVAELTGKVMGADITISSENKRLRPAKSEVDRLYADTTKARKLTGWKPEFGGLDGFAEGLRRTAGWFSKKENLAKYKPNTYTL